jgi:hypothetical protein
MSNLVKVKESPNLMRDTSNQAILNTDKTALSAYKIARDKQKQLNASIEDINTMKQDINDLKTLMQRILDKIG